MACAILTSLVLQNMPKQHKAFNVSELIFPLYLRMVGEAQDGPGRKFVGVYEVVE